MKKIFSLLLMMVLIVAGTQAANAQEPETGASPKSKWVSDKGYWVIETNGSSPKTAVVHFYNNHNLEIYTEKVEGIKLDADKRKTLKLLRQVLDQSLLAWEKTQTPAKDVALLKNVFKK